MTRRRTAAVQRAERPIVLRLLRDLIAMAPAELKKVEAEIKRARRQPARRRTR